MNVLFICSQNMLRSPTAEKTFANYPDVTTRSAGTDVRVKVTPHLTSGTRSGRPQPLPEEFDDYS